MVCAAVGGIVMLIASVCAGLCVCLLASVQVGLCNKACAGWCWADSGEEAARWDVVKHLCSKATDYIPVYAINHKSFYFICQQEVRGHCFHYTR